MTRHAKNCTAGTVYTYHERKKDTSSSGYGSKSVRVGKDSVKDFDCCSLTLQPCRNPVVTPDGHLYDKEAILEYIIHKKKEIAQKTKQYEKQKNKLKAEQEELGQAEVESRKKAFIENEGNPVRAVNGNKEPQPGTSGSSASICNMKKGLEKTLPSFWVPNLTPSASATLLAKPDEKVRCPMSGKPLKLKDLLDITLTPINDRDNKTSLITKQARYVCAVTNDVLGNSIPCAVLKTSGSVVTVECIEKIIKKDGMVDPINGKKLRDSDIIPLMRGASGFAGSGIKLKATEAGPAMQA